MIQNCKNFESHDKTNYFIIEQSFLPMNENLTWTKCCPISSLGPLKTDQQKQLSIPLDKLP